MEDGAKFPKRLTYDVAVCQLSVGVRSPPLILIKPGCCKVNIAVYLNNCAFWNG
jgi:hypothetical protein